MHAEQLSRSESASLCLLLYTSQNMFLLTGGNTEMGPMQLLRHLQAAATLQAMRAKLQVLLDSLPAAPGPETEACIDGNNWEGNAASAAWQYDCKVSCNLSCKSDYNI